MKVYADTSFIVALYLQQQNSPAAAAFMQQHGQALPFTPWHRLEVRNAIRLAVFHKLIDSHQGRTQLKQVETDLREETLLAHSPVEWVGVLRQAEKLGAAQTEKFGCRSGDLFHVAAALEFKSDLFLTFDARQKGMARMAGLSIKD